MNKTVNLLPGPVAISESVKKAFAKETLSHRSSNFMQIFNETKQMLLKISNAKYAEMTMGSGTTANDIVGGQISLLNKKGLILTNGEFGERLYQHAKSYKLNYDFIKKEWGKEYTLDEIENKINENKNYGWIWMVHHETSTGMANDISGINKICQKYNIKLCIDAISSIGTIPVDLSQIYLASAVSSKGLSSFAGLSIVFYNHDLPQPNNQTIQYLDLSLYRAKNGVPFSVNSNLVLALHQSLKDIEINSRLKNIQNVSEKIRTDLHKIGLNILVDNEYKSPSTITIVMPKNKSSQEIGDILKTKGFLLSYESSYLLKNNWIQICLMSDVDYNDIKPLFDIFNEYINKK